MDTSLLQPSIHGRDPVAAFSLRATFFTAFFGGPIAAVLIHGLNAEHFGRWERDRFALLVALIAALALLVCAAVLISRPDILPSLPEELRQTKNMRWLNRLSALVIWAALYWRLREPYRAARLVGGHRPAWGAGLACVLIGFVVTVITVTMASMMVGRP